MPIFENVFVSVMAYREHLRDAFAIITLNRQWSLDKFLIKDSMWPLKINLILMKIDYLIVGQGLAGSVLSYGLLKRQNKVLVIDEPQMKSSSNVAAGLFNPITGKKMVKTWLADQLFPQLIRFYQELEAFLGCRFLYLKPIYRPFLNMAEQNEWMGKSADPGYDMFIGKIHRSGVYGNFVNDTFGGLELNSCGYVDTATLLREYRNHLRRHKLLSEQTFEEEKLIFDAHSVKYKNIEARRVVFCDGPFSGDSRHFAWLPYRRVKGELLIIEPEAPVPVILNRGLFIIPLEKGYCKVGSTYDWQDTSWEVTGKAANELKERLDAFFKRKYKIMNQEAGIRPATLDRKPLAGAHPEFERLLIFNGFGTKGVSLIPYFSMKFCEFLSNGKELPEEVNISRYFSLY